MTQTRNSSNMGQQRTHPNIHPSKNQTRVAPVGPVRGTGQIGVAWASRDEQHPRVNTPKSNSRSPESLHRFAQDFGDSRNTKTCQIKRNRRNPAKNSSNPRTPKTPNRAPLLTDLGGESKGKRTMKGSHIHPPPNPQVKGPENTSRKPPREGFENHHK
jgi:hypothetical protein